MDHAWAAEQLTEFVGLIAEQAYAESILERRNDGYRGDTDEAELQGLVHDREERLKVMEPAMAILMDAARPGLASEYMRRAETVVNVGYGAALVYTGQRRGSLLGTPH